MEKKREEKKASFRLIPRAPLNPHCLCSAHRASASFFSVGEVQKFFRVFSNFWNKKFFPPRSKLIYSVSCEKTKLKVKTKKGHFNFLPPPPPPLLRDSFSQFSLDHRGTLLNLYLARKTNLRMAAGYNCTFFQLRLVRYLKCKGWGVLCAKGFVLFLATGELIV